MERMRPGGPGRDLVLEAPPARGRVAAPSAEEPVPRGAPLADVRQRIGGLVSIATANDSTISLEEIHVLLPPGSFDSPGSLAGFLARDHEMRERFQVVQGEVAPRGRDDLIRRRADQRALTEDRLAQSSRFLLRLERVCPWIELVGISGSVAYAGTKPHDDVDFFLVAGPRRMWISLALAMLVARLERLLDPTAPVYCFNRITERGACVASFRESDDPLFAREALNLRILKGDPFYRRLLRSAPWMEKHFPRLYAARLEPASDAERGPPRRPGLPGTLLNLAAFLCLGTYLWSVGLVRNARHAKIGRTQARFRTVVERDFCAYESKKYDDLREQYGRTF